MKLVAFAVIVSACGAAPTPPATRTATPQPAASASATQPQAQPAPQTCGGPLATAGGAPAEAHQILQTGHASSVDDLVESDSGYLATRSLLDHTTRIWDPMHGALLAVLPKDARIGWYGDQLELEQLGTVADGGFIASNLLVALDGHVVGSRDDGLIDTHVHVVGTGRADGAIKLDTAGGAATFTAADGRVHHLKMPAGAYELLSPTVIGGGHELTALLGPVIARWKLDDEPATPETRAIALMVRADFDDAGDALVLDGNQHLAFYPRTGDARPIADGVGVFASFSLAADGKSALFAANGALQSVATDTGTPIWREAGTFHERGHYLKSGFTYLSAVRSHDGKRVFAGRSDGIVAVRDAATGREIRTLGSDVRRPRQIEWIDDQRILSADQGRLVVWDARRGAIEFAHTETAGFLSAAVAGGDIEVARMAICTGGSTGTIAWLDRWVGATPPPELEAGKLADPDTGCGHTAPSAWPLARGIAKSARTIGAFGNGFDFGSGRALARSRGGNFGPVDSIAQPDGTLVPIVNFHPQMIEDVRLAGDTVAWQSRNNPPHVMVARASTGQPLPELALDTKSWDGSPTRAGVLMGVSPDGTRIAVRDTSDLVGVFDATTGALLQSAHTGHEIERTVAFDRDPKQFWIGTDSGAILHVGADGKVATLEAGRAGAIATLRLSPDRTRLLALGDDGSIRIVDAATGELRATLVELGDDEPIAFTPAGAYGGTAEAATRINWRFDQPIEAFAFEQFAHAFARPDIVAARLAGGHDDAHEPIHRPPAIELDAPAAAAIGAPAAATARIHAKFSSSRRVDIVRAYREGREVASASPCAPSGSVDLDVPLLAGGNAIDVVAFDDLGAASNAAHAQLARAPSDRGGAQPELYAIGIGVGAYPNLDADYQLHYAAADAKALATAFADDAGPGKTFATVHSTVLLDDRVTVASALAALDQLATMKPDDLAIVLLAGHGMKPSDDEDMVFVTSRASIDPASLRREGLAWRAIADKLARAKGRVIVLLDACHSGHVSQSLVVPDDHLAAELARAGRSGAIVFAAAKGRQFSYEPNGVRGFDLAHHGSPAPAALAPAAAAIAHGDHGLFTAALLATLHDRASDRDGDGAIELSEWIAATSERVSQLTDNLQTPWVARRELFGDFRVAGVQAHGTP